MAIVRNISPDALSVFRSDAPPCQAGDAVTIKDENFVNRAWPKSIWDLIEPPTLEGYVDNDTEDAHCFVLPEPDPEPEAVLADMTKAELLTVAAEMGVDVSGLTTKADLLAALTPQEG